MDAGNDLLPAEATHDPLHHGKEIQNTDVAVVSIDSQASESSGSTTILNISNYYSFQFFSDHLMMRRYIQIPKGKRCKYTGVKLHSSVQLIKPYSSTFANYTALATKKPRVDRIVNSLKFCPQLGCIESFTDEASLAEHMPLEKHTFQSVLKTMMYKARLTCVNKMKCSNLNSTQHQLPSNPFSSKTEGLENFTKIAGWALPKRKVFRYSTKQKRLFMEIFLSGQECRKKMSPEQVQQQLPTKLKPSEYVTSQQIRSLFSRQVSFYNQSVFVGL